VKMLAKNKLFLFPLTLPESKQTLSRLEQEARRAEEEVAAEVVAAEEVAVNQPALSGK